jgi:hypothetical protein
MEILREIVSEDIFTELELSRVAFRWREDFSRDNVSWGVFHGINSPEGILCGSNFLLVGGVFARKLFHGREDFRSDLKIIFSNENLFQRKVC